MSKFRVSFKTPNTLLIEFLYNFGVKYWDVVDGNGDGVLDFDEFRFTMAGFAATDAGVILAAFDENNDGILEDEELEEWFEFMFENLHQLEERNEFEVDKHALESEWHNSQGKFLHKN